MIIDVTREFNDEEYEAYLDLVQRYDEKYWLIEQGKKEYSFNYEGTDLYDIPENIEDLTTWEEDNFLEELSKRVNKCVDKLKREGWTVFERLLDYRMIVWLDRQDVSYFIIHDPMEFDYFWLAIKDDTHAYKLFSAKFRHNLDEEYFRGKGWVRVENITNEPEHLGWCNENLDDDFIRGINCSYFTEEAFVMYKLRWL